MASPERNRYASEYNWKDPLDDFIDELMTEYPPVIEAGKNQPPALPYLSGDSSRYRAILNETTSNALLGRTTANLRSIFGAESEIDLPILVEGNTLSLQWGAKRIRMIVEILRKNHTGKGYRITVEDQTNQFVLFRIGLKGTIVDLRMGTDEKIGFLTIEGEAAKLPEAAGLIRRLVAKEDKRKRR